MSTTETPRTPFIHLGARSEYSIGESLATVEDLCRAAARDGQPALALCDVNTLAAAPRFQRAAQAAGVRPVFGIELGVLPWAGAPVPTAPAQSAFRVRLLVESLPGWRTILRLSNRARAAERRINNRVTVPAAVPFEEVLRDVRGLVLLVGGPHGEVSALLRRREFERIDAMVAAIRSAWPKDRLFVELPSPLGDAARNDARMLAALAETYELPVAAVPTVRVATSQDDAAWRLLERAPQWSGVPSIAPSLPLPETMAPFIHPVSDRLHLLSTAQAAERFAAFPAAIEGAARAAGICGSFTIPVVEKRFPVHDFTRGVDAESYIWNTAFEQARQRYGDLTAPIKDRLNQEFTEVTSAGLANGLITLHRLHEELDRRGILCGPGAGVFTNSLLCSLLGITRLDPLRFGLPFRLPENIASQFPSLEIVVPSAQEEQAAEGLSQLFDGQVCSHGQWQRWRYAAALDQVATVAGVDARDRSALVRQHGASKGVVDESSNPEPEAHWKLTAPETLAWAARRLEGRVRSLNAVPGRFAFTVEALAASIPVRPLGDGNPFPVAEWSEEEIGGLRHASAAFRGLPLLDVIGEATLSVRLAVGDGYTPEHTPGDDAATYDLLASGATGGIAPIEAPSVRRVLRREMPRNIDAFIRLLSTSPRETVPIDLPILLLCHMAAGLKAHHPGAFYAAALSQAGIDTRKLAELLEEVRALRLEMLPLDINCSAWRWSVEPRGIRPGFCVVRDLPMTAAGEVLGVRRELAFEDIADLLRRTEPSRLRDNHVALLAKAGACDSFGLPRPQLLAQLERLLPLLRPRRRDRSGDEGDPLAFFGQPGTWWLETQESGEADESATPAAETGTAADREVTSGVVIGREVPDENATRFLASIRARAADTFGPRDEGQRVCLVGHVHAAERDPIERDILIADIGGCTARFQGALAKTVAHGTYAGRMVLVAGPLGRIGQSWEIDAEAFATVESATTRAAAIRNVQLDVEGLGETQLRALLALLKRYPGASGIRLASLPAERLSIVDKVTARRVVWCPGLEVGINALLGAKGWTVEEPPATDAPSAGPVPPRTRSLVNRVFGVFARSG